MGAVQSDDQAKARVRLSFERAAPTYDAAAELQRAVATRLLAGLAAALPARLAEENSPRLLDAGCGTGYGSALLRARWPEALLCGVDFAAAMLQAARRRLPEAFYTLGDLEALPLAAASCDVVYSSLCLQWCCPRQSLAEAARVLAPGGALAVSSLGPATFDELRRAFAGIDRYRHTVDFSSPAALLDAAAASGLREVRLEKTTLTMHYPDLRALLHAIKDIGASSLSAGRRRGMMGKAAWQKLQDAYEALRQPAGLPASYEVLLLYALK